MGVNLKYDANGLITAVVQDELTGDVRMVAWMNAEALAATLRTGRATFFSRSRQTLWTKGETSGNLHWVQSVHLDCDGDTLLVRVRPEGPSCHTGQLTCFFRELCDNGEVVEGKVPAATFLGVLEAEIAERQHSSAEKSYTRHLLDGGAERIGGKLREEAGELAEALAAESDERVASEAADVLYHLLVGLRLRGVNWSQVLEVLRQRSGTSGHEEKARRGG